MQEGQSHQLPMDDFLPLMIEWNEILLSCHQHGYFYAPQVGQFLFQKLEGASRGACGVAGG